jgi:hypothetical protein
VVDVRLKLSALWVALMLSYLLGDVLRIYSGNFVPGEIAGKRLGQVQWLGIAILMVIPVVMVVLSLTLNYPVNRWANVAVAIFFFLFNVVGLPTYPAAFDKFLNVVGLAFDALIIWFAFQLQSQAATSG